MILRRALPRQANRIVIAALLDAGGGVQDISVSDSGAGSDAIAAVAVAVAVADSGSGTDALSIAVAATVAESGAGTDYLVAGELTGACVAGVLRRDSTNGRYVRNDAGIVFLAGHHTWYNTQDGGTSDPPSAFDWSGYVTALQSKGLNFTKLWRLEAARDWPSASGQYFGIQPWVRSGPGNGNDGHLKFDLDRFNQDYFNRLRARCIQLGSVGIHAVVQLFDGFHVDATKPGGGVGDPWHYHPFNSSNNINGVNGDTNADGRGLESRLTTNTAAYAVQQAYIRKVVDTLNDLDNVMYEIANEEDPSAETWEKALVDYIHSYESGKPKQHIVGMTKLYPGGTNSMLTGSNADWISPDEDLTPSAQNSTSQAWMYDTDHSVGITTDRKWMWIALCQGYAGAWYMDLWDSGAGGAGDTRSDATYELIRKNLGWAQTYAAKMDLINATPQGGLSATGYCLAKTSGTKHQYLAYQSGSGAFTVDLSATSGTLTLEWVRVGNSAGTVQSGGSVNGGATRTLTPPWAGEDAVAYLEQDVPKAVAESATGTESIAITVALGIADTGSGADGPSGATASLATADSGTGADALAQLLASLSVTDSGSGADTPDNIAASLAVDDSGAGADGPAISVALAIADTGAGADEILQLVLIAIADAGAAVDSLDSITVTFAIDDTAAGSEALIVAATVNVADAGGGADAVSILTEAIIQIADNGAGVDAIVSPLVSLSVVDAATGADATDISVTLTVSDEGAADDLVSIITATLVSILETGSGTDALTVTVDPLAVADTAAASDTAGVNVSLTVTDAGSATDDVLQLILVAIADLATGTDAVGSIAVNVPVADAGQAADVLGAVAAALSVADTGSGLDVAVQFDSAIKLVSIVFTLARRTVVFAWAVRSIEFEWNV